MLYLREILPARGPLSRKPRPYRWGPTYESCLWWGWAETCLVQPDEMSPPKNETSITRSSICWQSMEEYVVYCFLFSFCSASDVCINCMMTQARSVSSKLLQSLQRQVCGTRWSMEMSGILTHIWMIYRGNLGKYSICESSGYGGSSINPKSTVYLKSRPATPFS